MPRRAVRPGNLRNYCSWGFVQPNDVSQCMSLNSSTCQAHSGFDGFA